MRYDAEHQQRSRERVIAEARVVDADGRLYASATSTLLVMDR